MRKLTPLEKNQVADLGPDDRTLPFYRIDVSCSGVMPDNELTTSARTMIGAEQEASHRIRIDVTFESHIGSPLNVQDYAISVIAGGHHAFGFYFPGQIQKVSPVQPIEPRQAFLDPVRVNPASWDMCHLYRFTRQYRRSRKLPEIGSAGHCADISLPIAGQVTGDIEGYPREQ